MKLHFFIALTIILGSCSKEESTISYAYLINGSTHKVVIKPYFSGVVPPDKTIILLSGQTKEIATASFARGIGNMGFNSSYFGGLNDSIIVTFDDLYSITHYFNPPATLSNKYYLPSSLRNIANPKSYNLQSRDVSKYQRENKYYYTFIEQDYLDAR